MVEKEIASTTVSNLQQKGEKQIHCKYNGSIWYSDNTWLTHVCTKDFDVLQMF